MSHPNTMHKSFNIGDNEFFYKRCEGLSHINGIYTGYCYIEDNEVFWHVTDNVGNIFETPETPIDDLSTPSSQSGLVTALKIAYPQL